MDYSDAPQVLRDFLIYHETICGHSKATVDQYYLDLRMFLRFLKLDRGSRRARRNWTRSPLRMWIFPSCAP